MKRQLHTPSKSLRLGLYLLALIIFSCSNYAQVTYTFNYTGGTQTIALLPGSYSIEVWGADGGGATNGITPTSGGKGGYSNGVYTSALSTTLNVYVGGHGGNAVGASNLGGGGGGMSDIAVASNPNVIIIAAGGGGGATSGSSSEWSTGGGGGGLVGGNALDGGGVSGGAAATGGSQTSGGLALAGGFGVGSPGGYGYGGGAANGGVAGVMHGNGGAGGNGGTGGWNGGGGGCTLTGGNDHAGGGGGGYYGGGGGRGDGGAGGGGSGYIGGVTSGTTINFGQPGFATNPDVIGNGMVLITGLCNMSLYSSGSNSLNPSICNGSGTTLTLSTNAVSNYSWSNGSTAPSITVSPVSTTVYTLSANMGSCTASGAITVSVTNLPVLSVVTSTNQLCPGKAATLTASGASTYTWTGGVTNGVAFYPSVTSSYTVIGENVCGLTSAVTSITVVPLPITASASSPSICAGQTATLSVTAAASSYTWQPAAIFNTVPSVTVTASSSTIYTITASDGTCSGVAYVPLNVAPLPTISVASASMCSGTVYTVNPSGAASYTLNTGQSGTSFTLSPSSTTNFLAYGTSSNGCNSSGGTLFTMTVNTTPTITVNSGTVCTGNAFTITPSGASVYNYSSGSAIFSPVSSTVISVTGTSGQGCVSASVAANVTVYITPTVAVTSGQICAGDVYTMVPAGASTYNFSNGSNTVSPSTTTSYSVTGTSAQGCLSANTAVCVLTVNPKPFITVNSGTLCSGKSFTINPSGAFAYNYSGGGPIVSPQSNAVYQVSGVSAFGCASSNTAICTVTVFSSPVISVTSGTICSGGSFTIAPTGASTYSYQNGTAVVSPTSNSTYTVVGSNGAGCISNVAISAVTVYITPTVSVNSGSICSGKIFTISPNGADSYVVAGNSFTVAPLTTTAYAVTGTSSMGCQASNTVVSTVTVYSSPTVNVNSGAICSGLSFTLSPTGASTYSYLNGGPVVTPSLTTSYSVSGTSTSGCISSVAAVSTVTVNALPNISVNSAEKICLGETTTLTATGADIYIWNTGAIGAVLAVSPTVTTSYTINGSSSTNCSSSKVVSVTVDPCTGLPKINDHNKKLLVYPNPNNGDFVIESTEFSEVYVFDRLGQLVADLKLNSSRTRLSLTDLPNGIYYLVAKKQGLSISQKIVLQK